MISVSVAEEWRDNEVVKLADSASVSPFQLSNFFHDVIACFLLKFFLHHFFVLKKYLPNTFAESVLIKIVHVATHLSCRLFHVDWCANSCGSSEKVKLRDRTSQNDATHRDT